MLRLLISWLTAAGMVFAVVAVAAPCATAGRFGPGQPGATTTVEPRPPRALCHQYCGAGVQTHGSQTRAARSLVQTELVPSSDAFQWADAAIGFAVACGGILLVFLTLEASRRTRIRHARGAS
jgi:hypothetical protein